MVEVKPAEGTLGDGVIIDMLEAWRIDLFGVRENLFDLPNHVVFKCGMPSFPQVHTVRRE